MPDFIKVKWSRDGWKIHAFVIGAYVAITTPLTWYACMFSREMNAFVDALTNTSNVVALGYAVYIYYLYDKTKTEAIKKAKERGIDVPDMEEALGIIYGKLKALDEWMAKNKDALKEVEQRAGEIDVSSLIQMFKEINGLMTAMRERGYTKEKFEKLLETLGKVDLDRVNKILDEWIEREKMAKQYEGIREYKPEQEAVEKQPPRPEPPSTEKHGATTLNRDVPPLHRRRGPIFSDKDGP